MTEEEYEVLERFGFDRETQMTKGQMGLSYGEIQMELDLHVRDSEMYMRREVLKLGLSHDELQKTIGHLREMWTGSCQVPVVKRWRR